MMLTHVIALASSLLSPFQETAPAQSGTPLWRGLETGSAPENVATALQNLPEIAEAVVIRKKGQSPRIEIKYRDSGIVLFELPVRLGFEFQNEKLEAVFVTSAESCVGDVFDSRIERLLAGLVEKYPKIVRLVDEAGKELETSRGLSNDQTLVVIELKSNKPPTEYEVSRARLEVEMSRARKDGMAALRMLSASRLESKRDRALTACPSSNGETIWFQIRYSSKQAAISSSKQDAERRKAQDESDKDNL